MKARSAKTIGAARAFTLLELLVVVAIIALLASILLPGLGRVKEIVRRSVCQQNLHTLGTGWQMYLTVYQNRVPRMSNNLTGEVDDWQANFNYLMYSAQGGWVASGLLYQQRMVASGRAWVCPTYESNFGHPWFGDNGGGWVFTSPNPWPEQPGKHTKTTYNHRRTRAYTNDALSQLNHTPANDQTDPQMREWGDYLLVVRGMGFIQRPSSFSFMIDGCGQNYMILQYGHSAVQTNALMANVLYLDNHVAPFTDRAANILSNNGIGNSGSSAINWAVDSLWMNIDEATISGQAGN